VPAKKNRKPVKKTKAKEKKPADKKIVKSIKPVVLKPKKKVKKAGAYKTHVGQKKLKKAPQKKNPALNTMLKELTGLKTEMSSTGKPGKFKSNQQSMESASMDLARLSDEEVAVQLTRLYFEEIARLGFKRRLDFDAIINAYYYCLQRLQNKSKEMEVMKKIVAKEEAKIMKEPKGDLFPGME
jgi:hypothetical protein